MKPKAPYPKTPTLPLVAVIGCLCTAISPELLAACQQHKTDLRAKVTRIIDGDTVDTDRGGRVRLIGINTPEIGYKNKPSERLSHEAKQALTSMIETSASRITLQFGQQRYDRYGRTLAHVFLSDGRNLAEQLLRQGLAVRVAFPPNLWAQDCYHRSETLARNVKKGLWRDNITQADRLRPGLRGFHIVSGRVERIGQTKKSIWLNLSDRFAVRIARRDLGQFRSINIKQLLHKPLLVRGWVNSQKNKSIIQLRHSSMLEIVK